MNKPKSQPAPAPWFSSNDLSTTERIIRRAIATVFGRQDKDTLAEISQLVWMRLLKCEAKPLKNPNGWVYEVARHEAIREARARRRNQSRVTPLGDEIADIADQIVDDTEEEERWIVFFKSLPRVDRSFVVAALRGESVEAIARMLGVSRAEGYRMRVRIRDVYLQVLRGALKEQKSSRRQQKTRS